MTALHGGQLREIGERFGIAASNLLDFSANINPAGPPPAVISTLRASLEDTSVLTCYPDLEETELKRSIARSAGVLPGNVIVANGFVPLLAAALRAFRIRRCLLPLPAFVEYRRTLEREGVEMVGHALNAAAGFRYDTAEMLCGDHDAILLANPQNPSGICHDAAALRVLIEGAWSKNIVVLLDEAFIDYLPRHSLTQAVDAFPNLAVFRSVTKFYGMPGLRVAYAVSTSQVAHAMTGNLPPWPITTLASRAVIAALTDRAYTDETIDANRKQSAFLRRALRALKLSPYPAAANFLLFQLPATTSPAEFWKKMIVEHRIVLRHCDNYESLAAGHMRVAVRGADDNLKLVAALRQCL